MNDMRKNNMPIEFKCRRKEDRRKKNMPVVKERRS